MRLIIKVKSTIFAFLTYNEKYNYKIYKMDTQYNNSNPIIDSMYNTKHASDRDTHIQFEAKEHVYTCNGVVLESVTTTIDKFFPKFDTIYWSERKARSMGVSPEELRMQWKVKGLMAANLGTELHANIERYFLGESYAPISGFGLFEKFIAENPLVPYRSEWTIYDEEHKVAGTIDFLDCQDGKYVMYDWKRSTKLITSNGEVERTSRFNNRGFGPIAHIHDTAFYHYALQQSMYQYILEKNYGVIVSDRNLVVLHPDNTTYHIVSVPYLKEEVVAILLAK
jgi:hypothetical protein